ncbi:MAG: hypothetical protein GQ576_04845 [Methanococcoides sp.]|nr:hypothetical protein [Methanococcoides sp.]
MNIKEFQELLSAIEIYYLVFSNHFKLRAEERGLDQFADVNQLHTILTTEVPKGIVDQENNKFQIIYRINDKYDAILICAVRNESPVRISLVTCIKQEAKRRVK